jgi:hypothetical protein
MPRKKDPAKVRVEINPTPEEIDALTAEIRSKWPQSRFRGFEDEDNPKPVEIRVYAYNGRSVCFSDVTAD